MSVIIDEFVRFYSFIVKLIWEASIVAKSIVGRKHRPSLGVVQAEPRWETPKKNETMKTQRTLTFV